MPGEGEVAEESACISKERLGKGQEAIERTGGRAELQQGWLRVPWYRTVARAVSWSTKANADLCFWKSFPTTSLAPSPGTGLLHSQPEQQALETQKLTWKIYVLSPGSSLMWSVRFHECG